MDAMHRFWSAYEDDTCDGAPTGVYIRMKHDCKSAVAASGREDCTAVLSDDGGDVVAYVKESCHVGRVAGLDSLFQGQSYMAYDYYWDDGCSKNYDNSAAYRPNGECEMLYDDDHPFRSAMVTVSNGYLTWTRNMGLANESLNCPGTKGPNYHQFVVPVGDINKGVCHNVDGWGGGFVFYNTSTAESGPALGTGAIAGIAGGCAVLIILVILLMILFVKRRNRRKKREIPDSGSLQDPFIRTESAWARETVDSDVLTLESGLWNDNAIVASRVPRDQVIVENLICRGGYGEIYRGSYNREAVAIKMLFPEMRSDLKKVNAFLAEAKLMAGLSHPHIVRFVGVSWGSLNDLCVLTELMAGGDLRSLLKDFDAKGRPQGIDHEKIRIAYHIAQALTYLHSLSPIVIHRDLKSRNVLLTENLDAKVTDFGVSRERQESTMTAGVGTMLWMAPEVMMAERYDEKADIFSFGVLLSELDLQMLPYSHGRYDSETGVKVPDAVILQKVALGSLQVSFSAGCLASVVQLGRECVALDPTVRPSTPMLIFRLQRIMKESFGAREHRQTYIL